MSALEDEGAIRRLVARAQGGDSLEEDFRELFLRHYKAVSFFFRRYGFSEEESRELTQETFLRVYKGIGQFGGEMRLASWIYQIARNLALNEVRSRATMKRDVSALSSDEDRLHREEAGGATPEETTDDPLENALAAERVEILRKAVEDLPPQMQRCVLLRMDRDLKYREIAALLGISIDTVKAHLFQARQVLREKLSHYFTDLDL